MIDFDSNSFGFNPDFVAEVLYQCNWQANRALIGTAANSGLPLLMRVEI
jgi:hypothetical protein